MPNRRADAIVDELEQRIVTGALTGGARLDEARLAEDFGTSRTPVREALQRLATAGLAEQIAHRGVFVRQPDVLELMEMFEVMSELEALCVKFACRRITNADISELQDINASCKRAVERDDTEDYYIENRRFHHLIYALSGNQYLEAQARALHERLRAYRRIQLQVRGRLAQAMEEHEAVVAALAKGNVDQAMDALRNHVAIQSEKFRLLMSHARRAAE